MIYGAHVKTAEDLDFLRGLDFEMGEVVLANRESLDYWLKSGVRNGSHTGFLLTAHGPREGPPNDLDNLWNRCYPRLKDTVDTAGEMGIRFLTIHLWMDRRFVKPHMLEAKTDALGQISEYARHRDVTIGVENLSESAVDFQPLVKAIPGLAITLDVGHGQLLAETNTSFDLIQTLRGAIGHVHLHDNRGGQSVKDDLHLAIGNGVIDFPKILAALVGAGYDGTVTLEVEKEDLVMSRQRVSAIIESLNDSKASE